MGSMSQKKIQLKLKQEWHILTSIPYVIYHEKGDLYATRIQMQIKQIDIREKEAQVPPACLDYSLQVYCRCFQE